MTRDELISKFCSLSSEVAGSLDEFKNSAHDCFCVERPNFQFDPKIVKFIIDATREKIDRENEEKP